MERHPIILPKGKHITGLIIDIYHRKTHHQGYGVTLNAVWAAGFWIIHGPSQVKWHIKECVLCRRLRADGYSQRMADLPKESGSPGLFLHVGMDVFGPYHIKFKRSSVKGTGLSSPAFLPGVYTLSHLADMSTDRFINALRRFLNRCGQVKSLWCDRGTNFVTNFNFDHSCNHLVLTIPIEEQWLDFYELYAHSNRQLISVLSPKLNVHIQTKLVTY